MKPERLFILDQFRRLPLSLSTLVPYLISNLITISVFSVLTSDPPSCLGLLAHPPATGACLPRSAPALCRQDPRPSKCRRLPLKFVPSAAVTLTSVGRTPEPNCGRMKYRRTSELLAMADVSFSRQAHPFPSDLFVSLDARSHITRSPARRLLGVSLNTKPNCSHDEFPQ